MRPLVRDVDLSPSGEHLAIMRLPGPGQNYVVDIYETAHLDKDPYTLGAEHMDIVGVNWANDERLLIRTRQPVEVPGRRIGYNRAGIGAAGKVKTYAWKLLSVGIGGGRWVELPSKSNITRFAFETYVQRLFSPRVVSRLPAEEDWVLIEWFNAEENGTEVFKVNVNNGRPQPVFKFSADYFGYEFDKDGNARVRSRANKHDNTITMQIRTGKEGDWSAWTDWLTWDVDEDRYVEILGFEPPDYNQAYVLWSKDRDTEGIYLFDMERPQSEPELLFAINRYDARDIVRACISQECVDGDEDPQLVGFRTWATHTPFIISTRPPRPCNSPSTRPCRRATSTGSMTGRPRTSTSSSIPWDRRNRAATTCCGTNPASSSWAGHPPSVRNNWASASPSGTRPGTA